LRQPSSGDRASPPVAENLWTVARPGIGAELSARRHSSADVNSGVEIRCDL